MAAQAPPLAPVVNPWIVGSAVMLGTFMEVLDTTVVNVSLPHIAGSLSATVDEATWVLTSYLVANAVILPMTGWLANFFGRKRLFMAAVSGFTVASFFCALAPNLPALILCRVVQGATGGAMQPLSQAVMLEAFPPAGRGKAMAMWGLGIVVAPMLGPVLGGWLTDQYSWRWIFYINIPVGIASVVLAKLFLFDPPYIRRRAGGVDYWGIGMLALGIGTLQVVLDKGQEEDWFAAHWIAALTIVSAVGILAFMIRELRVQHPIVHLRVLRNRTYAAGVLMMTVVGFVLYGSMVLLPIFLQTLLGYPAIDAGIAMAPRGLGSFFAMPIVGMFLIRFDPRKLLVVGLSGGAFTLYQLSRINLNAGYWDIFWPQLFQGMSMALLFVPLTTTSMDPIPKEEMGNATSIFNLMRNIGGSMGIAAATTFLARRQQAHINVLGSHVDVYSPAARQMFQGARAAMQAHGADPATATQQAYAALFGSVQRQAAMLSFNETFHVMALLFLAVIPLLLVMKKPRHHRAGPPAH